MIGNAENKIWSNQKKIKQLESIYEDLLTLKRGLGNVLSRHAQVCATSSLRALRVLPTLTMRARLLQLSRH